MKFQFPVTTNTEINRLSDFLREMYGNAEPIYFVAGQELSNCLPQLQTIFIRLSQIIYDNMPDAHPILLQRIDKLNKNISDHIELPAGYPAIELKNTERVCGKGKKHLEEICFILASGRMNKEDFTYKITAFLSETQIDKCMGGVLSIIQYHYHTFQNDFQSLVQVACLERIQDDAIRFVNKFNLLTMRLNAAGTQVRLTADPDYEIHQVNALYSHVASKYTWLIPIQDEYIARFPNKGTDWLAKFLNNYTENILVEYYIDFYLNNLPKCSPHYDDAICKDIIKKLDMLGPDKHFCLYDRDMDDEYYFPLKKNHTTILRASIIKRLLSSGNLVLEDHEKVLPLHVEEDKYVLYMIGDYKYYWLEHRGSYSEIKETKNISEPFPSSLLSNFSVPSETLHTTDCENLLRASAANNNRELLWSMILSGVKMSAQDYRKRSAIIIAADNLLIVQTLLAFNKGSINAQDAEGFNLLMRATEKRANTVIRFLLRHTKNLININATSNNGDTALMIAIEHDYPDTAEELLTSLELDINARNINHYTTLMIAVDYNRVDIASLMLVKRNPLIDAGTEDLNPLLLAAEYGYTEMARLLLKHRDINVNFKNKDGLTALMVAIMHDRVDIIKLLLAHPNINIDAQDSKGRTALIIASKLENQVIIKMLEEKKRSNYKKYVIQ